MEQNEDLIVSVIQDCINKLNEKKLDADNLSSKEFTEIIHNMVSLSKNRDQINESLQGKAVNNDFIEKLKERINLEIVTNPKLYDELSGLLSRLAN
jgi:Glu-tRNA(Gln) amidotransferase subunit E-like FAD-binding protein